MKKRFTRAQKMRIRYYMDKYCQKDADMVEEEDIPELNHFKNMVQE